MVIETASLMRRCGPLYRVYSDRCVPGVCVEFSKRNGSTILKCGLRYNLLLHMLNLWDNALVDTETVCMCMRIVDAHKE